MESTSAGSTQSAKRSGIWKNIRLALFSVAVTLVLVEVMIRVLYLSPDLPNWHREPHPVLGWLLIPNDNYRYRNLEVDIRISHNSQGLRDVEHAAEKPAGVFRILVLGDSFMEAYSVELADSFPQQLEQLAQADGYSQVEVINLGVGGYSTLQQYLVLQEIGLQYEPDLVVLAFYAENDVYDNDRALNEEVSVFSSSTLSRPFVESVQDGELVVSPPDYRYALRQWRLAKIEFWHRTAIGTIINLATSRTSVEPESLEDYYIIYKCEPDPRVDAAWDTTEAILTEINETVRQAGAEFLIFTVPSVLETNRSLPVEDPSDYCLDEPPANIRLAQIAQKHEILYYDLLPDFREAATSDELFRWTDAHWNEQGHALAAGQVYNLIVDNNLLPE